MQTKFNQLKKNHLVNTILLILFIAFSVNDVSAMTSKKWLRGAAGYNKANQSAVNENRPLIVYFNTDWCGWCKKMNKEYITADNVEKFLASIPKVDINPDDGKKEKSLQEEFGVTGYPSFFVSIPYLKTKPVKVYPFRTDKDLTTDEFITSIKKTISKQYGNKGHESYKAGEKDKARKLLDSAISYNTQNPYYHYLKGHINYEEGYKNRDTNLLKKAETDYLRALKINPDYKSAKSDLKKLNELLKKTDIQENQNAVLNDETSSLDKQPEAKKQLSENINVQDKGIAFTKSTKTRIAETREIGSTVTLKYNGTVNIYKESKLNKIAFKVPDGVQAVIIDSIIQKPKSSNPNIYKVEMMKNDGKYTGWVSAYVVH